MKKNDNPVDCVIWQMSSIVTQLESLIKTVKLTQQDVLELTECVIHQYLDQQRKEINPSEDNENEISVESDSEGDYIDKEGYIYDTKSHIRIGKKNLKTKEKVMYNIV